MTTPPPPGDNEPNPHGQGQQAPPGYGRGQQPPPGYGPGQQPPPGYGPGQQPPPDYGQSQQSSPGYGYGQQPPISKKDAKAQAAAAKAYERSQRSWFARHKFLSVLGAVVAIVAVIAIASSVSGNDDGGSASSNGNETNSISGDSAAGIGSPVRDGKFEFTVTAVDPGISTIGTEPLTSTAQGQFVLVHLTVRNIGDQQQMFDQSAQKMIDQQDRQLSSNAGDAIYVDSQNFLAEINPGNSVDGVVVFDIPKDSLPTKLELHDSVFSGGVTVQLS
ncbi:DUF4352 domain-containing protein [Rhodococcus sp. WS4]|nr:DUF4352 domain-containing protein [Rhodococcus sp. WS4]